MEEEKNEEITESMIDSREKAAEEIMTDVDRMSRDVIDDTGTVIDFGRTRATEMTSN